MWFLLVESRARMREPEDLFHASPLARFVRGLARARRSTERAKLAGAERRVGVDTALQAGRDFQTAETVHWLSRYT